MGIENDIQRLFSKILEQYGGNKSAAAEALGVNNVTFWGWISGKRSLNPVLCGAIDKAGGILLIPGETTSDASSPHASPQDYMQRIEELERQVEELKSYKIKWEGQLELAKAQAECSSKPKIKDADSTKKETA